MPGYAAIIADPPWQYDSSRALVGTIKVDGTISKQVDTDEHYPTMPLADIKALTVPAASESILFMWVTNPFLCDGSGPDVVRAWGFTPKTVLTWAKTQQDGKTPSMRVGHWFRGATEHVIVGVKGKLKRPDSFPALPTWFPTTRLPHSVKPDVIHAWAELAAPQGPWLEMFARRSRPGWTSWGNEAPTSWPRLWR